MISPVKIWRRQKETRNLLNKRGAILSWTTIYVAGTAFKKYAPYPVILVELENGKKSVGQLVDWERTDLKIGQKVKVTLRKVREGSEEGIITYGIKFKPL